MSEGQEKCYGAATPTARIVSSILVLLSVRHSYPSSSVRRWWGRVDRQDWDSVAAAGWTDIPTQHNRNHTAANRRACQLTTHDGRMCAAARKFGVAVWCASCC